MPENASNTYGQTPPRPAAELSKILFGRSHRLDAWHAVMAKSIDPPELFRLTDIVEQLGPGTNAGIIGQELKTLQSLGYVASLSKIDDHRSIYYMRLDSELWPAIQESANRTIELSTTEPPQV